MKFGVEYAYIFYLDFRNRMEQFNYDRHFCWLRGYPGFDMLIVATRVTQKTTLALSSYTEIVCVTITVILREKPHCGLFIAQFYQEMAKSKVFKGKFDF